MMDRLGELHLLSGTTYPISYGFFLDKEDEKKKLVVDESDSLPTNRLFVTYLQFAFAILCLCASVVCIQFLGDAIPEFQLNSMRFYALAIICLPVILIKREFGIKKAKLLYTAGVYVSITSFNLTYYLAAKYVAAGTVSGLNATVTLVGSALLTLCIKAERQIYLYVSTLVALIGILFLLQPSSLFDWANLYKAPSPNWTYPCLSELNNNGEQDLSSEKKELIGYALLLCSGSSMVAAFRFIRQVIDETNPFTLCFYLGFICGSVCLIPMLIFETPILPTKYECVLLLLCNCFGVAIYVVLVPYCLQYIEPPMLILMRSCDLLILLILQRTLLYEIQPGKGNWLEIVGGVICFTGCCLGPVWQLVQAKAQNKQ